MVALPGRDPSLLFSTGSLPLPCFLYMGGNAVSADVMRKEADSAVLGTASSSDPRSWVWKMNSPWHAMWLLVWAENYCISSLRTSPQPVLLLLGPRKWGAQIGKGNSSSGHALLILIPFPMCSKGRDSPALSPWWLPSAASIVTIQTASEDIPGHWNSIICSAPLDPGQRMLSPEICEHGPGIRVG